MTKTKVAKTSAAKQQKPKFLLPLGIVLLGAAYGFASWAIDSGRWLAYSLFFACLIFGLRYFIRGLKLFISNYRR